MTCGAAPLGGTRRLVWRTGFEEHIYIHTHVRDVCACVCLCAYVGIALVLGLVFLCCVVCVMVCGDVVAEHACCHRLQWKTNIIM
jgi:hypothetical protein